jgi:hypothetical protein
MEQPSISKLRFYSLGLVAVNKNLNSDIIEVAPVEDFPMLDGEITDNREKYSANALDASGAPINVEIDTTATIKAKWLPISNSNRKTSPDVRRGETVVLYKFADSDAYWWNTLFDDNNLRRLETVIYAFSNNSTEGPMDDAQSTYFLEVSTHRKIMHIHTSKSDGEPFSYDVQINAKEGRIVITDDVGNFIVLNSADKRITAQNISESTVDINDKNIFITAPETITLTAKNIIANASESIQSTAGNNITNSAGSNIESSAGSNMDNSAGTNITNMAGVDIINGAGSRIVTEARNIRTTTAGNIDTKAASVTSTVTGSIDTKANDVISKVSGSVSNEAASITSKVTGIVSLEASEVNNKILGRSTTEANETVTTTTGSVTFTSGTIVNIQGTNAVSISSPNTTIAGWHG